MTSTRTLHRIVTRATTLAAATAYLGVLFVGSMGPGGVEFQWGPPPSKDTALPILNQGDYPGCEPASTWPADVIPADAVIVRADGSTARIAWATAYEKGLTTIGLCS